MLRLMLILRKFARLLTENLLITIIFKYVIKKIVAVS